MLARVFRRGFYMKKAPGHDAFKTGYLDKVKNKKMPNDFHDPLSSSNLPKHIVDRQTTISSEKIASDYLLKNPTLSLSSTAVAYLSYRCSRFPEHDPALWSILEYHLIKKLETMTPRVVYGAYYGFLRTGLCSMLNFNLLHRDFLAKSWPLANTYECYEILEASSLCPRKDYDPKVFVVEEIADKLNHFWKKAPFMHKYEHLKVTIDSLYRLNLFKEVPDLWSSIVGVLARKKNFSTLQKWSSYYELLLYLRATGFEEKTGTALQPIFDSYKSVWESKPDFTWRYNIAAGRLYTGSEMVEKADQGPKDLTWEEADKWIAHRLPEWYRDSTKPMDMDLSRMLQEYYTNVGELKPDTRGRDLKEDDEALDVEDVEEQEEEEEEEEVEEEEEAAQPAKTEQAESKPAAKKGKSKSEDE